MAKLLIPGEVLAITGQAADLLLRLDNGDAALLYLHLLRRLRVHYRARGLALCFLAQPEPASSSGRRRNRAEITEQK